MIRATIEAAIERARQRAAVREQIATYQEDCAVAAITYARQGAARQRASQQIDPTHEALMLRTMGRLR